MRRIQKNNPNTIIHWDQTYRDELYDLSEDDIKFGVISNHIINETSVIEFGCGVGELFDMISKYKPKCDLFGVDYSAEAIKTINSKGYAGMVGNVNDKKKYDEYDYAISLETLEHLDEPQNLIDTMFLNLKPGGKAILTTPYLDHIPSSEHIWEFDYLDVKKMFAGFSQSWVFPWASGRSVINSDGTIKYRCGNFDTIFAIGVK